MKNLININASEAPDAITTINARELHGYLGGKMRFNDWIRKRIVRYGFQEGVDFIKYNLAPNARMTGAFSTVENFSNQNEVALESSTYADFGQQGRIEYAITLDMAKELAMIEDSDTGREARLYFIECEKRLTALPIQVAEDSLQDGFTDRLRALADKIEGNALTKPKADRLEN
jgi:anti-repressor protein